MTALISTATKLRVLTLWVGLFSFLTFPAVKAVQAQSVLLPHAAEYTLKMENRATGSALANINGTMSYAIDDECTGWSVTQSFQLFFLYNDQKTISEEKNFTNWEAKNGNNMQFASKSTSNNVLSEVLRGTASKEKDGTGAAVFSIPQNLSFALNKRTVFPNRYILDVLEHAKKGEKFFNKILFDGADKDGPIEVNSFIGKKMLVKDMPKLNKGNDINKDALGQYAWKIRMAFFPLQDTTPLPSHEVDLILHDNGVVSSTTVTYKGFAISESIQTLSTRPKPDC